MDDHSYSQEHIQKAEKKIKSQLEGNGVDPATVKLEIKRQGIAILTAQTSYTLDCHVNMKDIKGKATGGKLVTQGGLQKEIDSFLKEFGEKESVETIAKDKIKSLPLYGFGAENETIDLEAEKKTFTEHVSCKNCQGKGQSQCPQCQGRTYLQCPKCFGRGEKQCHICNGHGKIQEGSEQKQCYECWGKGEVMCITCQGKRQIPCSNCHMKGLIQCHTCGGHGMNSIQATVTPFLKANGAINTGVLEDDAKRMVGKIGGLTLAKAGHIDIKTVKPPEQEEVERAYYEDEPEDITNNTVFYEANMPWAVADLTVDGKPHDVTFAGQKGAVCESGKFMEQIVEPHVQQLNQALLGHGNAMTAINDACALRVSRETFAMLGKSKTKRTMQQLYKNYPMGWSKSTIQTFVKTSYKALQKATRRPRYIGLAIGLGLALLMNYIWFIGGIDLSLDIPSNYDMMDGLPFIIGLFITVLAIKIIGFFIYQSLMKDLGIKSKSAPPMGKAGFYALIGNLLIWCGFYALSIFN